MAQPLPPAAVAAAVPPPGGGGGPPPLPAAVAPRTYRERYADAVNNPRPERTAGFLAGYRFVDPEGGNVPAPAALRDQTVALSDRQPMAFLCLVNGQGGTLEVSVVHRLLRYIDSPGDEPSGFHDRELGLLGDILPHQYPVVDLPGTIFHLTAAAVRVPTIAAMEALIPTWDNPDVSLGPYADGAPETEVVRPRNTQLVPGRYAALIIHRRRIKPKQAYQEIVGLIRAEEALEACSDIVTWLRAACTARGGGGAQSAVPIVHHPLTPLLLPPEVYMYLTAKVKQDLPGLSDVEGGTAGTTATIVGALRALTAARDDAGGPDGRPPKPPRTLMEAYKETYRTLLKFCNVPVAENVAPIWLRLANGHKSEHHTLLTQAFQKVCMERGLSTEIYTPVVTTALKQMVVGFQFPGHGADDLSSGCQPFLVAFSGGQHQSQALAAASLANQLAQGEQSASLADYRTIRDSEKIQFPRSVEHVCISLLRYAVLCQALFQGVGPKHPFVEAMWAAGVGLQNLTPFITERYESLARVNQVTPMYFARILRAVQLGAHDYFQNVAINVVDSVEGIDVPSFAGMLQDLKRGTFHISTNWVPIPEEYLDPPISWSASDSSGRAPSLATTSGTQLSSRSVVSALTSDTTTRTTVARVSNPTTDAEFAAIELRPGGSRAVLREHRPPSNDAGHEFCVAWWTRGGCFPNCGRRTTHVPFASPGERSRLLSYVRTHLAATAAGAST